LPDGRRLEVRIPAGIADGGRVHIAAGNNAGGEFNLLVTVLPHGRFERKGDDLHTRVDVPLLDAVLGGSATVTTLRGQIELTLPPETQNGRRFRLAGQGMARLNDPERRGNLYAEVNVVLPTGLTDEQRRLFEQIRDGEAAAQTPS
jgi:DnaJ-class molecular chaperone